MTISCPDFSPSVAKARLNQATKELNSRGLYIAAKWAAELCLSVSTEDTSAIPQASPSTSMSTSIMFNTSTPSRKPNKPRPSLTSFSDISFPHPQNVNALSGSAGYGGGASNTSATAGANNNTPWSPAQSSFAMSPLPARELRMPPPPTGNNSNGVNVPSYNTTDNFLMSSGPVPDYESSLILLAKTYFDAREFARATNTLRNCTSPVAIFLCLYAKYLDVDRMNREEAGVIMGPKDKMRANIKPFVEILRQLDSVTDPFLLYLKGLVYHKTGKRQHAINCLVISVTSFPYNWSCWLKLASLIEGQEELNIVEKKLPQSFMSSMFSVHAVLEIHSASESLQQNITDLLQTFPHSLHLKSQQALIYYHLREFDEAELLFDEIYEADPYRVDDVDTYSNILYVMENRAKLSALANKYIKIDRNRPETCCLVGNYFSLRGEHEKAVAYFRRAIKLDRGYLSAWTLMGHEYVELKNTHAAVEAYRRAVDVNKKDYRAWYGLGQTYEILEMPFYSVTYYQKATTLKPYDPRMWFALGVCYEKLGQTNNAIECYKRAMLCSKSSDFSIPLRLANLEVHLGQLDKAAEYHTKVVTIGIEEQLDIADYVGSCLWLAKYEMDRLGGDLNLAEEHLERCMSAGAEEKEEAKGLLRKLRQLQMQM